MKKTVLATVLVAGVLSTGAFAYGAKGDCNSQGMKNQQGMQQQTKKKGWHGYKMRQKGIQHSDNMMMRKHGGMQMLSQLNLTDEQQYKLSILKDELKLEMKKLRGYKQKGNMLKYVKDDGFDKKEYMEDRNEMHEKIVELKAEHMKEVFKVLTKEQIAELKKNLKS
jgi:Spy/CpxP family protein refolding chaperone